MAAENTFKRPENVEDGAVTFTYSLIRLPVPLETSEPVRDRLALTISVL